MSIAFMQSSREELISLLPMIERTARGYARQRYKQTDEAFVDECIAEAYYCLTQMILEHYHKIIVEKPIDEERFRFYRMAVKYRLQKYWRRYKLPFSIDQFSEKQTEINIKQNKLAYIDHGIDLLILEDNMCKSETDKFVVDYYMNGNSLDVIAEKIGIQRKSVKKILTRIGRILEGKYGKKFLKKDE